MCESDFVKPFNDKLEPCPYCGRPAVLIRGSEMSDTSMIHKVGCSYSNCLTLEQALSGWSPHYMQDLNNMIDDWNTIVAVINQNIKKRL